MNTDFGPRMMRMGADGSRDHPRDRRYPRLRLVKRLFGFCESSQAAAFFAGEDFLGGEAEGFGRDLDLRDGGLVAEVG